MAVSVGEVVELMRAFAPEYLACEGDPVGLHAGLRSNAVDKILLALDATESVIDETISCGAQMIITHHPRFFRGLRNLDEDRSENALAARLVRNNIALYCAHTNLDITTGGVNDTLADLAGIGANRRELQTTYRDTLLKLTVFVPEENLRDVTDAICAAGAGIIGNYSECTYRVAGIGTFRPDDEANPHTGKSGELSEVNEWRLEAILPESVKSAVTRALIEAHPYEEPAYDLIRTLRHEGYGLGRVGELEHETTLENLAVSIKEKCQSKATCVIGDKSMPVTRVAVWGGSGAPVNNIISSGAQAIICGELSYHDGELLERAGIGAIILGHGPSEQIILPVLAGVLAEGLVGVDVAIASGGWPVAWSV